MTSTVTLPAPRVTVQRYTADLLALRAHEIENVVLADAALVIVNTSPDIRVQANVGPAPVPPDDETVAASVIRVTFNGHVPTAPTHK